MPRAVSDTPFLMQELGDIAQDLSVQAAILDHFGVIVAVNEQWKRVADARGLAMRDYGIGENYLRHCAFADPLSPRLIRGLSQVLSGETDRLSVVYSCDNNDDGPTTWFLLLAFPYSEIPDHIVMMHIDITVLISVFSTYRKESRADATGGDHSDRSTARPIAAAEHTLLTLIKEACKSEQPVREQRQRKKDQQHPPLSKRQTDVLALMAKGMTNAEIAHHLGLSLNTVKVYVSGILARLGLQSRAQVLHWALTRPKDNSEP